MACQNPLILRANDGAEYEILLERVRTRSGVRWTWINVGGFVNPADQQAFIEECLDDVRRDPRVGFMTRREAWENAQEYQGIPWS